MNPNGNTKHGGHGSLTYSRWKSMNQRCYTKTADAYYRYGGRGITVCDEWHDFAAFLRDMGECPSADMTLDRIDNNLGYQPGNCRWASKADQSKNRSICKQITFQGRTMIASDWAKELGMTPNNLLMRLRLGWSIERALTQPLKARSKAISGDISKIYRRAA